MVERAYESTLGQKRSVLVRPAQRSISEPLRQSAPEEDGRKARSIAIIGGGVSGIWSALTLKELGYTNITIIEKEMKIGGRRRRLATQASTTHSARWAHR